MTLLQITQPTEAGSVIASVAGHHAVAGFCVYLESLDFLADRPHVLRETEEPGLNVSSPSSNLI